MWPQDAPGVELGLPPPSILLHPTIPHCMHFMKGGLVWFHQDSAKARQRFKELPPSPSGLSLLSFPGVKHNGVTPSCPPGKTHL